MTSIEKLVARASSRLRAGALEGHQRWSQWLGPDQRSTEADSTGGTWILPDRRPQPTLPPIAALIRSQYPNRSIHQLIDSIWGDDQIVQNQILRSVDEARLQGYVERDVSPIPSPDDRAGYFGQQHVSYWLNGLSDFLYLSSLLVPDRPARFFDFGCSSGRVLRHFLAQSPYVESYGTDTYANSIRWMRSFLPHEGIYFQNSFVPTLPLADSMFDLIFAGSVFTHLDEFEEAWLLELRRILKPGGKAFVTFLSDRSWSELGGKNDIFKQLTSEPFRSLESDATPVQPDWLCGSMPAERVVLRLIRSPVHNLYVFHSTEYVQKRWGRLFEIEQILPQAHGLHQDAALLVKS
jgi:SAM-dependent methyltransferase